MNRFKNILVVVGRYDSERVVRRAMDLAVRNRAKVTLISPLGKLDLFVEALAEFPGTQNLLGAVREKRESQLQEICDQWSARGIEMHACVPAAGTPFVEVIRQVIREKHDVVFVAASDKPDAQRGTFSSLALHLIRKCPCPVWVVSDKSTGKAERILAAVDPQSTNNEADSLSVMILELATSLSRIEESELNVAHIYNNLILEGYEEIRLNYAAEEQESVIEDCIERAKQKREKEFQAMLEPFKLGEIQHEVHFFSGWPDVSIPSLAKKYDVDVLILGTISKGAPQGHWIGSTAESIVTNVGCSVIAVKPEGFVSPVRVND